MAKGRERVAALAKWVVKAGCKAVLPLSPFQGGRLCRPLKPFVVKPAQNWIVQMYREAQGICLSLKVHLFSFKVFFKKLFELLWSGKKSICECGYFLVSSGQEVLQYKDRLWFPSANIWCTYHRPCRTSSCVNSTSGPFGND